jgi:hypothetical protein
MLFPEGIGKSTKYLRYRRAGFTLSCLPICLVTRFLEPEVGVVSLLDWFESLLDWFVSLLDWFVSLLEWNFVTISVEVLSPSAITCKFLYFSTADKQLPGSTSDISIFCHFVEDDDKKVRNESKFHFLQLLYPDQVLVVKIISEKFTLHLKQY